jgi:hypothetical protein
MLFMLHLKSYGSMRITFQVQHKRTFIIGNMLGTLEKQHKEQTKFHGWIENEGKPQMWSQNTSMKDHKTPILA